MIVLTWLAWAATAVCLITYVRMQRGGNPAMFDWANAIGCIPLVIMDYLVGATPAAVISLAFGIAGAHGRIAAWRERRALKRWTAGLNRGLDIASMSLAQYAVEKHNATHKSVWGMAQELHARGVAEREASRG